MESKEGHGDNGERDKDLPTVAQEAGSSNSPEFLTRHGRISIIIIARKSLEFLKRILHEFCNLGTVIGNHCISHKSGKTALI